MIIPEAEIWKFVVVVSKDRNPDNWYLGGITNEEARNIELNLDFLDVNKAYQEGIWADGEGADWRINPYPLSQSTQEVESTSSLLLNLAKGGGVAIRFTPKN